MKKALICLFAMMAASTSLKAQEVTIVLNPGWTWISYPSTDTVNFAEAFGSFTPAVGDVIKSKWGYSTYVSNGQWKGNISQFYPGYGYHYKSNRTEPVMVTFNVQQPSPQVAVTTSEPTDITPYSATSGGSITTDAYVFAKGICWADHPNPTPMDDDHSENGGGDESFTAEMTDLSQNTTYYVRAYVVTQNGIVYGNEVSFTTIPIWTIEAMPNPTDGGTITGTGNYEQNAVCTLTAIANEGYVFANWTENGEVVSTDANYIFTVNADRTLVANFTLKSFTINVSANPSSGGSVSGGGTYNYGQSCTVHAYANTGYVFSNWTANGTVVSNNANYTFTVSENRTLVANFTLQSYLISVSANPSSGGSVSGGGTYNYGQSCTVHATPNSGYTFFSWMENGSVVSTDAIYTFTVNADRTLMANFDNHAFVDLGLPNGTLWATCNIGADTPEDYGDYFAWGETQPKEVYDWSTYQYANGTSWQDAQLTKYCSTDNMTTLLPEDDAATANWGDGWRMPSKWEWMELLQNTTNTWTTQNGVYGRLFTAFNGNTLFLPAAGYYISGSFYGPSDRFGYWSRTVKIENSSYWDNVSAWDLLSFSSSIQMSYAYRADGHPVRAVRCKTTPPAGVINGLFSVSANKQVYFSKGNLQYKASSNTWRFAENQFDYIGNSNSNISSSYSGWIDLFGWGTSGYDHGAVCYQPWSTSTSNSDYYAYGRSDFNLNYETGQADWGFNSISNGGSTTNLWRTLTKEEWEYVINTRNTASGIRFAKANVNNINGVILLPDDWSDSTYGLHNTNNSNVGFDSNVITISQWATLESVGAIFLPAAGYRSGALVSQIGSYGRYYSASIPNYSYQTYVISVYFNDSNFFDYYADYHYLGFSVRLVQDVE